MKWKSAIPIMIAAIILTVLNISTHFQPIRGLHLYPFFHWKLIPLAAEADPNDPNFTSFEDMNSVRFRIQEKIDDNWVYLDCDNRKCLYMKRMFYKRLGREKIEAWIRTAYTFTGNEVRILRERASPRDVIEGNAPSFGKPVLCFNIDHHEPE